MTVDQVDDCMKLLTGLWPHVKLDDTALEVYALELAGLDYELAREAIRRAPGRTDSEGRRVKAFPAWADLLELYDQVRAESLSELRDAQSLLDRLPKPLSPEWWTWWDRDWESASRWSVLYGTVRSEILAAERHGSRALLGGLIRQARALGAGS